MDSIILEDALENKCKNRRWLVWIFFLTASPIMFNASHLATYEFLGGTPSFFCNIPELVVANWTKEQIREISSPGLQRLEMDPIILEAALEKKCKNRRWLIWILFLTASPIMFNASHLASYVFLGGNPPFFCNIPELVEANWTKEQIREISTSGLEKQSCVHYAWNYSLLKDLHFDEAVSYCNVTQKPDVVKCKSYIYDEKVVHQTIVSEWDLVCDDLSLRSTAQGSVAVGKLIGALVGGLISDRFGRNKTFIFSSIIFMVAGPSAAFVNSYVMFIVCRVLTGVASAGLFETAFTILMELTVKNYRVYLGIVYNKVYSFGIIYLPLAAYLTNNWRQLQLAISVPMFALLIHCWFMPESPRWLITREKLEKASNITESVGHLNSNEPQQSTRSDIKGQSDSCCNGQFFLMDFLKLFSTLELAKRTLICNYLFFFGYFNYYVIAFNGSNFEVDPYIYMGLNGIVDLPGLLIPIFSLTYFGRKSSGITLYTITGFAMIVLTVLPKGWPVMGMNLVGRLVGTAALSVVQFQTQELFPTETRNTALGSCVTVSQLGALLAPYVVDLLGQNVWWKPTTLCGLLALLAAFLLMFVPETRDSPMLDTICEMKTFKK